jgi:TolA-binding protein
VIKTNNLTNALSADIKSIAKRQQGYERRLELIKGWDAMRTKPLTKAESLFFADAVERAKGEQSVLLYVQGLDAIRLQRWQEAATAFEDSLRYDDASATASRAKLGLATAYRKLRRQKDAITLLQQVAESVTDKEAQDDALELLALCQIEIEAFNDAKDTWRTLLRKFPDSHYAPEAKLSLQTLALTH